MKFFEAQRYRKRSSKRLYWLLALCILVHTLVLSLVFGFVLWYFLDVFSYWVFIIPLISTIFIYIVTGLIEYQRTSEGGRAVAKRVGAIRLLVDYSFNANSAHFTSDNQIIGGVQTGVLQSNNNIDESQLPNNLSHRKVLYTPRNIAVKKPKDFPDVYRRYYEFAEQMAIASGQQMPLLYVLPDEMGINGFVAGRQINDMVIVLTQGALEKLSDEGLYGIIAHLYGTILNGDAKFNMHLLVMMAGIQLLHDFVDSIQDQNNPNGYASSITAINQSSMLDPTNFKISDVVTKQAQRLEKETKDFEHSSQWIHYWRNEQKKSSSNYHVLLQNSNRHKPSLFVSLVYAISGSGVFWSKLITQRYNREREYLADATSLQLTRSNAIIDTLRAIGEDPLGSRLVYTPHIDSISHFLFASHGADIDAESWFSSHPSINSRMQIINNDAYQEYSRQMLNKQRINQAKLKQIHEQRRKGTWQELKDAIPRDAETAVVAFKPIVDKVVDGRLQTQQYKDEVVVQTGKNDPLKPYRAPSHEYLPKGNIALSHFKNINLPQVITEYLFHTVGNIALIEIAMLCHQHKSVVATQKFGLKQIWLGSVGSSLGIKDTSDHGVTDLTSMGDIMRHKLNYEVFLSTAKLDRRMDSGLIELAVQRLSKQNLSQAQVLVAKQVVEECDGGPKFEAIRQYKQQLHYRQTLLKYQQGLIKIIQYDTAVSDNTAFFTSNPYHTPLMLWQAVHFYMLVSGICDAVDEHPVELSDEHLITQHLNRQKVLIEQLTLHSTSNADKALTAKAIASVLTPLQLSKLQLLALMIYQDTQHPQPHSSRSSSDSQRSDTNPLQMVMNVIRLARLIDIPFDNNDTIKLIVTQLIERLPSYHLVDVLGIILHIKAYAIKEANKGVVDSGVADSMNNNHHTRELKSWLSSFYTAMLSDGKLAQEEYDVLTLLTKFWLGKRVLIE